VRFCLFVIVASLAFAQLKHSEATSTIDLRSAADGSQTIEIRNTGYEVTGTDVPGRPSTERLLLRKTVHSTQVLGDIGMEATVTLEAWRLGDDLRQKPLYAVNATGDEGHVVDNALFVATRGLEETEWWSVYKLGTGRHLFDTYVPLVSFSISRQTVKTRYAGFEVPEGEQGNTIGLLTYASEDHVIRQALLTSDDAKHAQLLRSFADTTRTLAAVDGTLRLALSQNYPSPANTVEVRIPLRGDDLDLAHAQLPPRLHISARRPGDDSSSKR
jgi:hypothetical protein